MDDVRELINQIYQERMQGCKMMDNTCWQCTGCAEEIEDTGEDYLKG